MSERVSSIRLFQRISALWILGFLITALPSAERLWLDPVSPALIPDHPAGHLTHLLSLDLPEALVMLSIGLLVVLSLRDALRGSTWWTSLLIWFLYVNLMNRAWLAGSGGQQLMANLLFWNILLSLDRWPAAQQLAFWIIRLQLLLVYMATGLHKLTGVHWVEGTAMAIVSTDPAFGPRWIAGYPGLSMLLTWAVLLFQLTFPLAVWWRSLRMPWLLMGCVFHLATALWMDMPEMGLAFIAAYSIWLNEREARWVMRPIGTLLRSRLADQGALGRP